jgi:hypothetical protein
VKGAGIEAFSAEVKLLELGDPRAVEPDELLIDVQAAGVGNGWDLGRPPPMAVGVQAAGVVRAVGVAWTGSRSESGHWFTGPHFVIKAHGHCSSSCPPLRRPSCPQLSPLRRREVFPYQP